MIVRGLTVSNDKRSPRAQARTSRSKSYLTYYDPKCAGNNIVLLPRVFNELICRLVIINKFIDNVGSIYCPVLLTSFFRKKNIVVRTGLDEYRYNHYTSTLKEKKQINREQQRNHYKGVSKCYNNNSKST